MSTTKTLSSATWKMPGERTPRHYSPIVVRLLDKLVSSCMTMSVRVRRCFLCAYLRAAGVCRVPNCNESRHPAPLTLPADDGDAT